MDERNWSDNSKPCPFCGKKLMGIYIKGMEMPKDKPLIIKINPDGAVSSTFDNDYRKYEAVPVLSQR